MKLCIVKDIIIIISKSYIYATYIPISKAITVLSK